ncbi:flavin-containing monooxygenase [Nocardia sp. NPDC059239]|uniref:flavin-containing monooxygenase n=1 Tax=unclassified Nocardia TaxID=2637762 RepID=UPI0036BB5745
MPTAPESDNEHLDVLILGAGLSGIGAAYYVQQHLPGKTYAILEARGALGGTWDLFRYPGIRSDSDLHTFGYEFKPWENEKSIAGASVILSYLQEAAAENGIDRHIRLNHKAIGAVWSSEDARWTVEFEHTDTGERSVITCSWLFACSGYYRYDEGFTPHFEGREEFGGTIVHPQHWPENLDYRGKRVVVIGSGATAVTILPSMADDAAHVTMLQRSPSYIMPVPSADPIANALRKVLGSKRAHGLNRRRYIAQQRFIYRFCQNHPRMARRVIRWLNARELPKDYPLDTHFSPAYNPWDQRLCAVPDADLFKAIREGKASVVTDHIDTFTERGIRLRSGAELEADIIVTATGLNMQTFGGIDLTVDGVAVDLVDRVAYKGVMLSDVPNFSFIVGYTNSSWTLKVGLVCEFTCRVIEDMERTGNAICYPHLLDPDMPTRPLFDFDAGYVRRAIDELPRQGVDAPWITVQDYRTDVGLLRNGSVHEPELRFSAAGQAVIERADAVLA